MAAESSVGNNTLPDTYKQVEYIQSSGTQYIDTGYIPSNNTKIKMSMGGWNQTGTFNNLFGARLEWSATGRGFHLGYDSNTPTFFWMFGGKFSSGSGLSFNNGSNHSIEMSQSGIYEDGTLKEAISSATFTSPVNMYIFCDNNNGAAAEYGVYKLYYFKIYNSGTLVRDFVPVIRKSDNKPGLYDLVNNIFYMNAGTGEFTYAESAESGKIKKIYLGTNLIRPTDGSYQLIDETNFKNQQISTKGYFRGTGWNSDTSPSNISYDTQNGRMYGNNSHAQCRIEFLPSKYDELKDIKKLKIIYDYFTVPTNSNTYPSGVRLFGCGYESKESTIVDRYGITISPLLKNTISLDTPYKGIIEYDMDSDSGTFKITRISDNTKYTLSMSGVDQYWTHTTDNSFFADNRTGYTWKFGLGGIMRDQGPTAYFGDMHIYGVL